MSECVINVTGKGQFKEEFGTCGLVGTREVKSLLSLDSHSFFDSYGWWCLIERDKHEDHAKQGMPRPFLVW